MAGPINAGIALDSDVGGPVNAWAVAVREGGGSSPSAPTGYTEVNLSAATKLDPNSIEGAAPLAEAGGYYTVEFDATIIRNSTGDMLAYYTQIPDVTWGDNFNLSFFVAVKDESDTKLVGAAYVSDGSSNLETSHGWWVALSEENADSPDTWLRRMDQTVPLVGSVSGTDEGVIIATVEHHTTRDRAHSRVYDINSGSYIWKKDDASQTDTSPVSSGNVYVGALIGCRAAKGASETLKIRIGYYLLKHPTFS